MHVRKYVHTVHWFDSHLTWYLHIVLLYYFRAWCPNSLKPLPPTLSPAKHSMNIYEHVPPYCVYMCMYCLIAVFDILCSSAALCSQAGGAAGEDHSGDGWREGDSDGGQPGENPADITPTVLPTFQQC